MDGGRVNPTVGIIGGGQLARMTHQAAIDLGIDIVVLCQDADAPAVRAGAQHCPGRPDRLEDLVRLAERCDVVTVDHEKTPAELLRALERAGHRVAPGARAAEHGQDKALVRALAEQHGISTAPWTCAETVDEITEFGSRHGWPLYLKLPTGGYDGRGVWRASSPEKAAQVVAETQRRLLVEPAVAFRHEVSVLVVRSTRGETVVYPPVETVQRDGQCHEVFVPTTLPVPRQSEAQHLAVLTANAIDLVGTMALELFVTADGLLLNELAVRPHNSGHLTIEACATSQFENHLRAVLGLPLGSTELIVPAAAMVNLVGGPDGVDPFLGLSGALAVPGASVHCYGKAARPRRKVGHVTATGATVALARSTAARAADRMSSEVAA